MIAAFVNTNWNQQVDKEALSANFHLPEAYKTRLELLSRNISRFAFEAIKDQLRFSNVLKTMHCKCALKIHYGIPCCHMYPADGPIPLSIIPRRWHLFPEKTASNLNDEFVDVLSAPNVIAVVDDHEKPTIEKQVAAELVRIENLGFNLQNQQQLADLLHKLKAISNDSFIDMHELQSPPVPTKKTTARTTANNASSSSSNSSNNNKRLPITLEIQDEQSKKKAKTGFGAEAAATWEGKGKDLAVLLAGVLSTDVPKQQVATIVSPQPDGNCGFRVLALALKNDEDMWPSIKDDMFVFLQQNRAIFLHLFREDELASVEHKLSDRSSPCNTASYFNHSCAILAANAFSKAIAWYSVEFSTLYIPFLSAPTGKPISMQLSNFYFYHVSFRPAAQVVYPSVHRSHNLFCTRHNFTNHSYLIDHKK